jgi:hypothetical protein
VDLAIVADDAGSIMDSQSEELVEEGETNDI